MNLNLAKFSVGNPPLSPAKIPSVNSNNSGNQSRISGQQIFANSGIKNQEATTESKQNVTLKTLEIPQARFLLKNSGIKKKVSDRTLDVLNEDIKDHLSEREFKQSKPTVETTFPSIMHIVPNEQKSFAQQTQVAESYHKSTPQNQVVATYEILKDQILENG